MNAEHESKLHDAAQTLAAAASNYLPGVLYCIILMSPNQGPSGRRTGVVGNLHPGVLREMADQIEAPRKEHGVVSPCGSCGGPSDRCAGVLLRVPMMKKRVQNVAAISPDIEDVKRVLMERGE